MARQVLLFFLIILISFVVSFDFDDGDDFFDDIEDSGDKRGLDNHGSVTGDGETVFASESKNKLTDGRETITKEWVKWLKDPKTGKWSKKRTARHFMRLKNGTVVEMEDNGSGDTKPDGEMTKVNRFCILKLAWLRIMPGKFCGKPLGLQLHNWLFHYSNGHSIKQQNSIIFSIIDGAHFMSPCPSPVELPLNL